ncbi:MAG: signal peptidase II [Candidatus Cloacimonetes bacterium]|nr:signal peptidase II [Candidatus Cloacimonadota bacterium]
MAKELIIITNFRKYSLFFLLFLSLDQFSKIAVRKLFQDGLQRSYSVLGNFFKITYVENPGAVFGISIGTGNLNQIIFLVLTLVAICIIVYLFLKSAHPLADLGFVLILSGAFGNLIDRIAFGKVTDFLDFDFFDFIVDRWYVFNIADSCILIGVSILMIYFIFFEKKVEKSQNINKVNLENK